MGGPSQLLSDPASMDRIRHSLPTGTHISRPLRLSPVRCRRLESAVSDFPLPANSLLVFLLYIGPSTPSRPSAQPPAAPPLPCPLRIIPGTLPSCSPVVCKGMWVVARPREFIAPISAVMPPDAVAAEPRRRLRNIRPQGVVKSHNSRCREYPPACGRVSRSPRTRLQPALG
jgi:hypothetical protein